VVRAGGLAIAGPAARFAAAPPARAAEGDAAFVAFVTFEDFGDGADLLAFAEAAEARDEADRVGVFLLAMVIRREEAMRPMVAADVDGQRGRPDGGMRGAHDSCAVRRE